MSNQQDQKKPTSQKESPPRSMHEDVPLWCDSCSCEPEPRWQQVEEEMEREAEKERKNRE